MDLIPQEKRRELEAKNVLGPSVVEKYRLAGQIAQTCLKYVLNLIEDREAERTIGEICRLGDEFILKYTRQSYVKDVKEKGVALPVQILRNEFISGVAPEEIDVYQGGYLNHGDLVKVVLGVYVDGYTAQVAHTVVVRDDKSDLKEPLLGTGADAMCAAYLSCEAVVAFLSLAFTEEQVTGSRIRELVESVASSFNSKVVTGSRVRKVERFLAGQHEAVRESITGVSWDENDDEEIIKAKDDFIVTPGTTWLVDIQCASGLKNDEAVKTEEFTGHGNEVFKPPIYSRDYTVQYGLRLNASKSLLRKVGDETSVYPFKLSFINDNEEAMKQARLGLNELVQHHILLAHPMIKLTNPDVKVAREMTTVCLVPASESSSMSNEFVRLTGGPKIAPPSWIHSQFEIVNPQISQLLSLRKEGNLTGIKFHDVQPIKGAIDHQVAEMELDE